MRVPAQVIWKPVMRIYNLQFATIVPLQDDIAEVIIRRDIEMDIPMVETYHEFLRDHFSAPFALLVNKKYPYTYTFEAQQVLATIPEISAMGILTYNAVSHELSQSLINQSRIKKWNAKVFSKRDEALQWINSQLHPGHIDDDNGLARFSQGVNVS